MFHFYLFLLRMNSFVCKLLSALRQCERIHNEKWCWKFHIKMIIKKNVQKCLDLYPVTVVCLCYHFNIMLWLTRQMDKVRISIIMFTGLILKWSGGGLWILVKLGWIVRLRNLVRMLSVWRKCRQIFFSFRVWDAEEEWIEWEITTHIHIFADLSTELKEFGFCLAWSSCNFAYKIFCKYFNQQKSTNLGLI